MLLHSRHTHTHTLRRQAQINRHPVDYLFCSAARKAAASLPGSPALEGVVGGSHPAPLGHSSRGKSNNNKNTCRNLKYALTNGIVVTEEMLWMWSLCFISLDFSFTRAEHTSQLYCLESNSQTAHAAYLGISHRLWHGRHFKQRKRLFGNPWKIWCVRMMPLHTSSSLSPSHSLSQSRSKQHCLAGKPEH